MRLRNRLEGLLEQMGIKLSHLVSDLLGVSSRRMLTALAEGETDPEKLAALAAPELRATTEQLCDALHAASQIHPSYRLVLKQCLERIQLHDRQIEELSRELAVCLKPHEDGAARLATFASAPQMSSWVGGASSHVTLPSLGGQPFQSGTGGRWPASA